LSGVTCKIIITGQFLQAMLRSLIARWPNGDFPEAQVAIGDAEALCELGTATYDDVEVMDDTQKDRAHFMMKNLVSVLVPLVSTNHVGPQAKAVIVNAISNFNSVAGALFTELTA
jgi:hypothetical protein